MCVIVCVCFSVNSAGLCLRLSRNGMIDTTLVGETDDNLWYPHDWMETSISILCIYIYIMHLSKKNTEACRFTWLCWGFQSFQSWRFHQDDSRSFSGEDDEWPWGFQGFPCFQTIPFHVACRLAIHRSPLFFSWKWIVNARGSFVMCDCQRVYRRFWILLIQICAPQYYAPISRCNVIT